VSRKREVIQTDLTVVFAALPSSRWIANRAGWTVRRPVCMARRQRIIEIQACPFTIATVGPLPE
jgi:hypothetical protein